MKKKRGSIQKNAIKVRTGLIEDSIKELKKLLRSKSPPEATATDLRTRRRRALPLGSFEPDTARDQKISIDELKRLRTSEADVAKGQNISVEELKSLLATEVNAIRPGPGH